MSEIKQLKTRFKDFPKKIDIKDINFNFWPKTQTDINNFFNKLSKANKPQPTQSMGANNG